MKNYPRLRAGMTCAILRAVAGAWRRCRSLAILVPRRGRRLTIAAVGALFAAAAPSYAMPILRVTSGADTLTLTEDLAGDMISLSGVVRLSVDDWRLHGHGHSHDPAAGAVMNLNSVSVTTNKAASLKLELTETGFMSASDVANFVSQISGAINRKEGSSLVYAVYADSTNTTFGKTTQVTSSVFGPGTFAHTGIIPAALDFSMPYSITIVASLTHGGAGTSKFDSMVRIPEPASTALLGAGLLMFGAVRGRRRAGDRRVEHVIDAARISIEPHPLTPALSQS